MIRVILAIVRVSAKYCRQSPEGFAEDASRSHLTFAWDSQSHESPCNFLGFSI